MTPSERIAKIDDLIATFEQSASDTERELAGLLTAASTRLLSDPGYLLKVINDWNPAWSGLVGELANNILDIWTYNRDYFAAIDVDTDVISSSASDLLTSIGLTVGGTLVASGYLDLLLKDTSVQRSILSSIISVKARKGTADELTGLIQKQVTGDKESKGLVNRLIDSLPTQPHVEADRFIQSNVAVRAGLNAAIYTGGLIDSSRPFCKFRNNKVFLRSEIVLFGTRDDKYPGYVDKSIGYFSGRPRSGYEPFSMLGGVHCRHHLSYINNREAMRRRDDLEEVNGVLSIKTG